MTRQIYLGYDIPGYHQRLAKAISRYGLPKGAPHAWRRNPDVRAWDDLGYMQPSGAMYWQCYLYAALQAAAIDQRPDLSTITILDKRWHFGERHWNFAPGRIEYQVRRALNRYRSFSGLARPWVVYPMAADNDFIPKTGSLMLVGNDW